MEENGGTDAHVSLTYDAAIIKLYAVFEDFMRRALGGAINNNPPETIAKVSGVPFPRHLTDETCEFLIVGNGCFDFRGRDGLIEFLGKFLPRESSPHYRVESVVHKRFKDDLECLSALRNHAAHNSKKSRKAVLDVISAKQIGMAGVWLKRQPRSDHLCRRLADLSEEILDSAPY